MVGSGKHFKSSKSLRKAEKHERVQEQLSLKKRLNKTALYSEVVSTPSSVLNDTVSDDYIAFAASESESESETETPDKSFQSNVWELLKDVKSPLGSKTPPTSKPRVQDVPWVKGAYSKNPIIALHEEIIDYVAYIKPTPQEYYMRKQVVSRLENVVSRIWEGATLKVFGSFETLLYLPTSDIDLCVFGLWDKPPLFTLKKELDKAGIAKNIKVVDKARVPIIKYVDAVTNICVDISFNLPAGVKTAELVKEYLKIYPVLYPLMLVLKQFLVTRQMNEVFTGGIGSFSLLLMTVSFLQLHPRLQSPQNLEGVNLGVLIIEFFELYGLNFNYHTTAISVRNGGFYFSKEDRDWYEEYRPLTLCIEDPLNIDNNTGKGSFNISLIRMAFAHNCRLLVSIMLSSPSEFRNLFDGPTILSCVLKIDPDTVEYRKWIEKCFQETETLPDL
eukprot:Sdes_comp9598_c0_seq1m1081